MFNWFGKKQEPAPAPVVHEIVPKVQVADVAPQAPVLIIPGMAQNVLLKRLKWVVCKSHVGIVTELDSSGFAKIDFVSRQDGTTVASDRIRCSELRLAKFDEIPECRRGNLTREYAATLGYF